MKNSLNIISSKQSNDNLLNEDESKKQSTIKREKIEFNPDNSKTYTQKQTMPNDKSINNIIERNNIMDEDFKLHKKGSEEIDIDKKSMNIDDKILNRNPSQCFVFLMRLFYSRNCVNLYIALISVSVIIFIYSLISYFKEWGNNKSLL